MLLVSMLPLWLGALLSDIAYGSTYETQWINFASWLIVGALLFCGVALLWSLIVLVRADRQGGRHWLAPALLAGTFALGFIDALVHAKDAWASMPEGTILSAIIVVVAFAAAWIGLSSHQHGTAS